MLNALLDRDELLIALQHSAAQRRLRLGFLAAITGLFAWLATPAVALTWGVILGALEVLGGVIYEKQRARGIGAGTMRDHYVRIVLTMIVGVGWAIGPILAWPLQAPDTRISIYIWVASLILYSSLFSYRSVVLYLSTMLPQAFAACMIVIWETSHAPGRLVMTLTVVSLAVGFAAIGAMRRRGSDIRIDQISAEITAGKKAAEEVSARLNFAMDSFNAAIWEIDFATQSVIGADQLARILHYTMTFEDFISSKPGTVHGEDQAYVRDAFTAAMTDAKVDMEHRVERPGGDVRWVHTLGFPVMNKGGRIKRLVMMTTDETERKDLEMEFAGAMRAAETALAEKRAMLDTVLRNLGAEQASAPAPRAPPEEQEARTSVEGFKSLYARLERLLREIDARDGALTDAVAALEKSRAAAEAANVAKSQFVANMSHELRTPLNAVIGYAEILEEDLEAGGMATEAKDAHRIRAAARNLLGLINEILDLAKIEAGKMEATVGDVDVGKLVKEAVEVITPAADSRNNLIEVRIDDAVGPARTDDTKVRQCLLNLLSNAAKFTENGKIIVNVDLAQSREGALLRFTVRDTGIGIAAENIVKLFTPFNQADNSTTRKYGGTGLGLAITKKMAEILGGDVTVTSEEGVGSVFTLTVRTALDQSDEMGELAGDGPLVLIVDDESAARDLVKRSLARLDFATRSTPAGRTALQIARQIKPALIMLDIRLPDLSGWLVLEALKHDPATADIPVVVLTIEDDRARALALGASEHLLKPADRDAIAAAAQKFALKSRAAA